MNARDSQTYYIVHPPEVFSQSMWALRGSFFPCSLTSTDKIYTTIRVLHVLQNLCYKLYNL
jgi:hypothetical protein